jgi:hypothetical protein
MYKSANRFMQRQSYSTRLETALVMEAFGLGPTQTLRTAPFDGQTGGKSRDKASETAFALAFRCAGMHPVSK